ncbi:MAG: metallophosphatase family protein [Chloroflexota bacterium]|nr:metallophosphatase family protein [Chloroflexota bacterium]
MRIAVIADVHANFIALEAVLAQIATQRVDQIVCLGDVASLGPQPCETLARLQDIRCPIVMGNGEAQLLEPVPLALDALARIRKIVDIYEWCRMILSDGDRAFMRSFAPTVTVPLGDDATLLCFHGSPRSYYDVIRVTTPEDELDKMLGDTTATALAGGHTHQPFIRRYRERLLFNPGCVGVALMAYRASNLRRAPWAEYATVTCENGSLRIELCRTAVDIRAVEAAALQSGMPHADWWAAGTP